jgi:hypothetical protein
MPTPASLQLKSLPDDETLAVLATAAASCRRSVGVSVLWSRNAFGKSVYPGTNDPLELLRATAASSCFRSVGVSVLWSRNAFGKSEYPGMDFVFVNCATAASSCRVSVGVSLFCRRRTFGKSS